MRLVIRFQLNLTPTLGLPCVWFCCCEVPLWYVQEKLLAKCNFMKNIISGRRRIFGYGFKDVVGPLKTTSRAQRDKLSLEVRRRL